MGQHKAIGASAGIEYKNNQKLESRFVKFHRSGNYPVGSIFTMLDGKRYRVESDGSYRLMKSVRLKGVQKK